MRSKIQIPSTLEAAQQELGDLGSLATATDWKRAAIVATFVELKDGRGQPKSKVKSDFTLTTYEFAELGIVGLKSKNSVARYAKAWMDEVGVRPEPGKVYEVPRDKDGEPVPFPILRTDEQRGKKDAKIVARGLESQEVVAKVVENMTPKARTQLAKEVISKVEGQDIYEVGTALSEQRIRNTSNDVQKLGDRMEKGREARESEKADGPVKVYPDGLAFGEGLVAIQDFNGALAKRGIVPEEKHIWKMAVDYMHRLADQLDMAIDGSFESAGDFDQALQDLISSEGGAK